MVKNLILPVERKLHGHQITVCWQSPDIQRPPEQGRPRLVTTRSMVHIHCTGLHWPLRVTPTCNPNLRMRL